MHSINVVRRNRRLQTCGDFHHYYSLEEPEKKPENIIPRVKALLGADAQFELDWASVYTFACLRMDQFVHGRVIFAGDSAHGVSPFGARGANSGVQDAENLA